MEKPLVSIIVPVYNIAVYLPACITSLLNQTYEHIEIICINDGSADDSLAVLEEYARQSSRIRIVSQKNAGPGPSRNRGLEEASGAYVLFVDGDDWIGEQTVEACVMQAQQDDADIVCFGFQKVRKPGKDPVTISSFAYEPGCFMADEQLDAFFAENSHRKEKLNTAAMGKFYRRSLLEQHRIRFRLSFFEDTPFLLETVYHARKVVCIPGSLYYYLIREKDAAVQSITGAGVSAGKLAGFYAADNLMEDFLSGKGVLSKYEAAFRRFHNARVLLYGGYFEVYVEGQGQNKEAAFIFLEQLRRHRKGITFHRKGLYRAFRKRVFILRLGLWLSGISPQLAHRFFLLYERTLAPK